MLLCSERRVSEWGGLLQHPWRAGLWQEREALHIQGADEKAVQIKTRASREGSRGAAGHLRESAPCWDGSGEGSELSSEGPGGSKQLQRGWERSSRSTCQEPWSWFRSPCPHELVMSALGEEVARQQGSSGFKKGTVPST